MKNLYRERYDYTDVKENYINYKLKRDQSVPNLPAFKEQYRLNIQDEINKERSNRSIEKTDRDNFIKKDHFFNSSNGNINVPYEKPAQNMPVKILHSCHDSSIKTDIFIKKNRAQSLQGWQSQVIDCRLVRDID